MRDYTLTSQWCTWVWDRPDPLSDYTYKKQQTSRLSFRANKTSSDGVRATPYYSCDYSCSAGQFYLKSGNHIRSGYHAIPNDKHFLWTAQPWAVQFPNSLENQAIGSLMANVSSSEVDLGVMLGEMGETAQMLAQALKVAIGVIRSVRLKRPDIALQYLGIKDSKGKFAVFESASSAWLAVQYGWRPFVADVYAIAQTFEQQANNFSSPLVKKRAQATTSYVPSDTVYSSGGGSVRLGVEASCTYAINSPLLYGLNSVGLLNPLSIAWELVPLSFVIDWFLPIGRALSSLTQGAGLSFKTGYITRFSEGKFNLKRKLYAGSGDWPNWDIQVKGMDRKVLSSFPKPKLAIPPALNFSQLTSTLALMHQRRRL